MPGEGPAAPKPEATGLVVVGPWRESRPPARRPADPTEAEAEAVAAAAPAIPASSPLSSSRLTSAELPRVDKEACWAKRRTRSLLSADRRRCRCCCSDAVSGAGTGAGTGRRPRAGSAPDDVALGAPPLLPLPGPTTDRLCRSGVTGVVLRRRPLVPPPPPPPSPPPPPDRLPLPRDRRFPVNASPRPRSWSVPVRPPSCRRNWGSTDSGDWAGEDTRDA